MISITSAKAAELIGVTCCDPLLACLRACLDLAGLVQALPDEAVGGALPPGARDVGLSRVGAGRRLQHRGTRAMSCSYVRSRSDCFVLSCGLVSMHPSFYLFIMYISLCKSVCLPFSSPSLFIPSSLCFCLCLFVCLSRRLYPPLSAFPTPPPLSTPRPSLFRPAGTQWLASKSYHLSGTFLRLSSQNSTIPSLQLWFTFCCTIGA